MGADASPLYVLLESHRNRIPFGHDGYMLNHYIVGMLDFINFIYKQIVTKINVDAFHENFDKGVP